MEMEGRSTDCPFPPLEGKVNMLNLVFGDKEYNIKFGYKATVRTGLVNKVIAMEDDKITDEDRISKGLLILPEMLLVGLQHEHEDEFGFNYDSEEEKEKKIDSIMDMLDVYFDNENSDFYELFNSLQEEMLNNGFLAAMFRQQLKEAEQKKTRKK